MRKWLHKAVASLSSTHASDTISGNSNKSCILDILVNSTEQAELQESGDGKQYSPAGR